MGLPTSADDTSQTGVELARKKTTKSLTASSESLTITKARREQLDRHLLQVGFANTRPFILQIAC